MGNQQDPVSGADIWTKIWMTIGSQLWEGLRAEPSWQNIDKNKTPRLTNLHTL